MRARLYHGGNGVVKTQPSPCLKLLAWSDSSPIERCRPLVAALAVAGCGGGDDNSTTGTSGATGASGAALSEQEFVSQANAACKEANDKIAALKAPTDLPSTADFASQAESIDNDVYAKLAALTPPSKGRRGQARRGSQPHGADRVREGRAAAGVATTAV